MAELFLPSVEGVIAADIETVTAILLPFSLAQNTLQRD